MLLVKTKLGVSSIHGIGLFADQFIPKGTVTWEYDPVFDVGFTEEEVSKLSELARNTFIHFAYYDKDLKKYILCADGQRFINHSEKARNIESATQKDIASKDIQPGEELLCDYYKFDDTYFERMNIKKSDLL